MYVPCAFEETRSSSERTYSSKSPSLFEVRMRANAAVECFFFEDRFCRVGPPSKCCDKAHIRLTVPEFQYERLGARRPHFHELGGSGSNLDVDGVAHINSVQSKEVKSRLNTWRTMFPKRQSVTACARWEVVGLDLHWWSVTRIFCTYALSTTKHHASFERSQRPGVLKLCSNHTSVGTATPPGFP